MTLLDTASHPTEVPFLQVTPQKIARWASCRLGNDHLDLRRMARWVLPGQPSPKTVDCPADRTLQRVPPTCFRGPPALHSLKRRAAKFAFAMANRTFLFTSESVNEGHPDKLCDQVKGPDAEPGCGVDLRLNGCPTGFTEG